MSNEPSKTSENEPDFICEENGADRNEMIATAAYYRSEKQGFNSGDEIRDWIEAEAEIDSRL